MNSLRIACPAIVAAVLAAPPWLAQDVTPGYTADEFAQLMFDVTTRIRDWAADRYSWQGNQHGEICQAVLDVRELDSVTVGDYDETPIYLQNDLYRDRVSMQDLTPDRLIWKLLAVDCRTDNPDKPIERYTVALRWQPRTDGGRRWLADMCATHLIDPLSCNPAGYKPRSRGGRTVELPVRPM